MKHKIILFILCPLIAGVVSGFIPPPDNTIALAVKVIHDVSKKAANLDWATAKKGDFLYSGDQIRTGERSIAIVKFKDNSMLRVRESSELKLFGEVKEGVFSKTVNISHGEFSFDIQKQKENEKFTFSSPTSVAAIRGTKGVMDHSSDGDQVVVLEGLVNLLNSLSNKNVDIAAGETGESHSDGSIFVRKSRSGEVDSTRNAINAGHGAGTIKQLDIELKDGDNNKKKLRIKYHG
ncbi:MAG: FecR domain-containing protein [Bacteroidota bacterium]